MYDSTIHRPIPHNSSLVGCVWGVALFEVKPYNVKLTWSGRVAHQITANNAASGVIHSQAVHVAVTGDCERVHGTSRRRGGLGTVGPWGGPLILGHNKTDSTYQKKRINKWFITWFMSEYSPTMYDMRVKSPGLAAALPDSK